MKMTLREAANAVGRNKSTVFRAIQDGKLKAERNESGLIFIESKDLLDTFPPEDQNNRMKVAKRGRPIGSRKKKPDGTIPEQPQIAVLGQELIRLEKERDEYKKELADIKARQGADSLRLGDVTLERERLLSRINLLERSLDEARAESASKDGRIYELKAEKDKLSARIESLETKLENRLNTSTEKKESDKKSLLEKIFA